MIQHRHYAPAPALRPYIRCFHFLENTNDARNSSPQRVTPDGCFELNFNLAEAVRRTTPDRGAATLDKCYTVGRSSQPYFVQRTGAARVISVRFQPWGAHPFTPMPLSLITDRAVPSIELFGKRVQALHERLGTLSDEAALAELGSFFHGLLACTRGEDALVTDAARIITASDGRIAMHALHTRYGITPRRLQQRFKERIGTAPVSFARLVRFQRSLARLHGGAALHDAAFEGGYYDQPHFAREFKDFAGIPPSRYVREAHPLNDAMLLGPAPAAPSA